MNRVILVLLCTFLAFSITACAEEGTTPISSEEEIESEIMTLDPKEAQLLKKAHPDCFGLDTREGLNVLVFEKRSGKFEIRLAPGNKTHWTFEEATRATFYSALTLEECKKMLQFYHLPDDKVYLRPYQDPLSSYLMTIDEALEKRIAGTFDNRYKVGTPYIK